MNVYAKPKRLSCVCFIGCCGGFHRARPAHHDSHLRAIHNIEFPASYAPDSDCMWYIMARAGERVVIDRADVFDLEPEPNCQYDFLELIDIATGNATRYAGVGVFSV